MTTHHFSRITGMVPLQRLCDVPTRRNSRKRTKERRIFHKEFQIPSPFVIRPNGLPIHHPDRMAIRHPIQKTYVYL